MTQENTFTTRDVPRCTACGNVGQWEIESLLRPMDWVIGLVLMILGFVPGVVYLGVTITIRSNKNNRAKICTKCKARNMFTFQY